MPGPAASPIRLSSFAVRRPYLAVILGGLFCLAVLALISNLVVVTDQTSPTILIVRIVPVAAAIAVLWLSGWLPSLSQPPADAETPARPTSALGRFARSLNPGWYMLAVALVGLGFNSLDKGQGDKPGPALSALAILLVSTVLIGLFEELLCRGFIQNVLTSHAVREGTSIWRAIVISSAIFGVMHVTNLIFNPHIPVLTASQVVYATCAGIVLGVAYHLSGSLLAVAIIHGIVDFLSALPEVLNAPAGQAAAQVSDIGFSSAIFQVALLLPGILVAAWAYRRARTRR